MEALGLSFDQIDLVGLRIDRCTAEEAVEHIAHASAGGRGGWCLTANLDQLRLLTSEAGSGYGFDPDLVVADGMPLVWASRLQRTPLPERVAGSDLIYSLSKRLGREGGSVFLLGGNEGTAEEAAERLLEQAPGLRVAGTWSPMLSAPPTRRELAEIRWRLRIAHADVVYVALGFPKQEQVIQAVRDELPGTWFLGLGISFSFVTGDVRRAPRWMQRAGLEWLHRVGQEPGRLARRYFVDGLPFAAKLLLGTAFGGLRRAQLRPGPERRALPPKDAGRTPADEQVKRRAA